MSRHKERVFSYRKYRPFTVVIELDPKTKTPDECKEIIDSHVGRNSTFFIEAGRKTSDIITPQILFDMTKRDPRDRQNFLDTKASAIKTARRVFIKTSTLPLHSN